MKNGWTGGQYSIFRILLGLYLLQHFLTLVPWGTEAFSNRGVLPVAAASPLIRLFPNVLAIWDQPGFLTFLLTLGDRKSTRLNSSHPSISYAVFCLKKKKKKKKKYSRRT